jgi:ABC-type glutathione transport system ATPase component
MLLEVRNLRVVYRSRGHSVIAVDDVSVHVDKGEVVGIVGESGSGKTTLAMAVASLGPMTSGEITLLGTNIATAPGRDVRRLRSEVQVVFQDPLGSLDPLQSVRGGFSELRKLHPERTAWTTDEQLLSMVGLGSEILGRRVHEMSGGQAQRVSIARALLLRPSLLVCDEPTSALDVSVQAQILSVFHDLRDRLSISILFISHDLAVVRHLCDRVYVMKSGKVVEQGDIEPVLQNPEHPYTRKLVAAIPGTEVKA